MLYVVHTLVFVYVHSAVLYRRRRSLGGVGPTAGRLEFRENVHLCTCSLYFQENVYLCTCSSHQ